MSAREREKLVREIEMQMFAIKRINLWRIIAVCISAIGMMGVYFGFAGASKSIVIGILGISFVLIGFAAALTFGLGIKNGNANVKKMMTALEAK